MNSNYKNALLAGLIAAAALLPSLSHATLVTYTDRNAFQAALGSFSVDTLNGINQYGHYQDVRADFTFNTSIAYGCINHAGCGDNSGIGFDNSYLWNYQGQDTFVFNAPTNGIGFDYANPSSYNYGAAPILQGLTASSTSGFFGVISDVALTTFTFNQTSSYLLIDNITYGSGVSSVPAPSVLALLGLGMLGFMATRRKAK